MINKTYCVITTIQQPTDSVSALISRAASANARLIVIGDKKGPSSYDIEHAEFWSLQGQLESKFELAHQLPTGHYTRKNLGYLIAIAQGADCIYETDDDNAPLDGWGMREESVRAHSTNGPGWINVFRLFSTDKIWPRGFPLDEISRSFEASQTCSEEVRERRAPIQQGLVNHSPDVDAIWRLVLDKPFSFHRGPSVYLPPGSWSPFNSQSTWWFALAFPLMYLPSHCSFRMTDIWRSFVAQRCLWELDLGVVFHAPEVVQHRNEHDLMRDFKEEIPGYQRNKEFVALLENLSLTPGSDAVSANLLTCYEALVEAGFFSDSEIDLVRTWLADLEQAKSS